MFLSRKFAEDEEAGEGGKNAPKAAPKHKLHQIALKCFDQDIPVWLHNISISSSTISCLKFYSGAVNIVNFRNATADVVS